ncbi:hypothetical protein HDU97_006938 [Phlyctochytrium planicorne]|nr:hypothetical protein HDU97_006938 [Phlyctochytrium planicorne]
MIKALKDAKVNVEPTVFGPRRLIKRTVAVPASILTIASNVNQFLSLPFEIILPEVGLPPTFEDHRASILYGLKATISFQEGMRIMKSTKTTQTGVAIRVPVGVRRSMVANQNHLLYQEPYRADKVMYTLSVPRRSLCIGETIDVEITVLNMPPGKYLSTLTVSIRTQFEFRGKAGSNTSAIERQVLDNILDDSWEFGLKNMRSTNTVPDWKRKFSLKTANAKPSLDSPLISVRHAMSLEMRLMGDPKPNVSVEIPIVLVPPFPEISSPPLGVERPDIARPSAPSPDEGPSEVGEKSKMEVIQLNGGKTFQLVMPNQSVVCADYDPVMPDELELRVGDIIILNMVHDDGWAHGTNLTTSESGMLPLAILDKDESIPLPAVGDELDPSEEVDKQSDAFSFTHTAIELIGPPKPKQVNRFHKYQKTEDELKADAAAANGKPADGGVNPVKSYFGPVTTPSIREPAKAPEKGPDSSPNNLSLPPPKARKESIDLGYSGGAMVPPPHPRKESIDLNGFTVAPKATAPLSTPGYGSIDISTPPPASINPAVSSWAASIPQPIPGVHQPNPDHGLLTENSPSKPLHIPIHQAFAGQKTYLPGSTPPLSTPQQEPVLMAPAWMQPVSLGSMTPPLGVNPTEYLAMVGAITQARSNTPAANTSPPLGVVGTPPSPPSLSNVVNAANAIQLPPPPKRTASMAVNAHGPVLRTPPVTIAGNAASPPRSDSMAGGRTPPTAIQGAQPGLTLPPPNARRESIMRSDFRKGSSPVPPVSVDDIGKEASIAKEGKEISLKAPVHGLQQPASTPQYSTTPGTHYKTYLPTKPSSETGDTKSVVSSASEDDSHDHRTPVPKPLSNEQYPMPGQSVTPIEDDEEDNGDSSYDDYLDYWLEPLDTATPPAADSETASRHSKAISVGSVLSRRSTAPRPPSVVRGASIRSQRGDRRLSSGTATSSGVSIPSRRSSNGATLISAFNLVYGQMVGLGNGESSPLDPADPRLRIVHSGIPQRTGTNKSSLSAAAAAAGRSPVLTPVPNSALSIPSPMNATTSISAPPSTISNLIHPVLPMIDFGSDEPFLDLPAIAPTTALSPTRIAAPTLQELDRLFLSGLLTHPDYVRQREILLKLSDLDEQFAAKEVDAEKYFELRDGLMAAMIVVPKEGGGAGGEKGDDGGLLV